MSCCMASLLGSSDTAGIWSSVPGTPNRLIESVPAKLAARKPWRSHASFCTAGVFNRFSSVPPFSSKAISVWVLHTVGVG